MKKFTEVVAELEALQMMPKTMPGLEKIKKAFKLTDWYDQIDPDKIIVVAGTNGKGTTCAALEALLIEAKQKVGFYSSPHLVSTTERIRLNGQDITEAEFLSLYDECLPLIESCGLSHFEALTLMAGFYFFSKRWNSNPDFVIFEVGLGGSFDAVNAFPHKYCAITKLGIDHVNILGHGLVEIAQNKFGIVGTKNIVVHHKLPSELEELKKQTQKKTNSNWLEAEQYTVEIKKNSKVPSYFIKYGQLKLQINLPGARAAENIMTAVTLFRVLGFDSEHFLTALNKISWSGRMQKIEWAGLNCPLYVSGDHNRQGVESLLEILKDFAWHHLHLIVGIGIDKDAEQMLNAFSGLTNVKLYLTETPFKGRSLSDYPEKFLALAEDRNASVIESLAAVTKRAQPEDLALVTGSLYLVGEVLKLTRKISS